MKTFKIMMAIAVAIFATTSLIVSLTSPIKSLLDVNVKALTQDEGGNRRNRRNRGNRRRRRKCFIEIWAGKNISDYLLYIPF